MQLGVRNLIEITKLGPVRVFEHHERATRYMPAHRGTYTVETIETKTRVTYKSTADAGDVWEVTLPRAYKKPLVAIAHARDAYQRSWPSRASG